MTPEQIKTITELRSQPILLEFAKANIDAENGILRDVVMVEEGDASGHGVALEAEFISDLVAYDRRVFGDAGVRAKFGHVFGSSAMGSQLGYFRNVRKREKNGKMQAIADLHLLKSADKSPTRPGMYTYVLEMAQEAPDFIMASIEFRAGRYYQRKANGHKKYIWEYAEFKENGEPRWDSWIGKDKALGKVFVEFGPKGEHYFTALVDDGAATENLFHSNPPAPQPDKKKPTQMTSLKELFFGKESPTEEVALSAEQIQELRDNMTKVEAALSKSEKTIEELQAAANKHKEEFAAKEKELDTAQARIDELEKKAADTHDKGPRKPDEMEEEKEFSFLKDPMTLRAKRAWDAQQKTKKVA